MYTYGAGNRAKIREDLRDSVDFLQLLHRCAVGADAAIRELTTEDGLDTLHDRCHLGAFLGNSDQQIARVDCRFDCLLDSVARTGHSRPTMASIAAFKSLG